MTDIPAVVTVCGNLKASAKTLENMCFICPDARWTSQVVTDFLEAERAMAVFKARFTSEEKANV
jgi:hypothetical protein